MGIFLEAEILKDFSVYTFLTRKWKKRWKDFKKFSSIIFSTHMSNSVMDAVNFNLKNVERDF